MAGIVRFAQDWSVKQTGAIRRSEDLRLEYDHDRLRKVQGGSAAAVYPNRLYAHVRFEGHQVINLSRWEESDNEASLILVVEPPGNTTQMEVWFSVREPCGSAVAWDSRLGQNFQFEVAPTFGPIMAHRTKRARVSADGWPAEANEAVSDPACVWAKSYRNSSVRTGCVRIIGYSATAGEVITAFVEFDTSMAGSFVEFNSAGREDLADYRKRGQLDRGPGEANVIYPPSPDRSWQPVTSVAETDQHAAPYSYFERHIERIQRPRR